MKYWVKINHGQESLGSRIWDDASPFVVGVRNKLLLDNKDKNFMLVDLSSGKSLQVSNRQVGDEAISLKLGGYDLQVTAFPSFEAASETEVAKLRSVAIALPEGLNKDLETESFNKISRYTFATGAVSLCALFLGTWISTHFAEPPLPVEVQPKMSEVKLQNAPTPAVVAAAYEQAMKQGAMQAAKMDAKKSPTAAKKSAAKNLSSAFASLMGGGLTAVAPKGSGNPTAQVAALLPGVQGNGSLGRGEDRQGGARGESIVQVAVSGSGEGGYQAGGDIGIGGVAGQGSGWLNLNLAEAMIDEGLSRDEVGKVIHGRISEIRYCYESSMLRKPELEGKLVIDFVIGSGGRVRTANVKETSVADERLNECILKRLARWEFPKPKSGVEVAVSYPFIFKRLRR